MMVILKNKVVVVHVYVVLFLRDVPYAFYSNLVLLVIVDVTEVNGHMDHLVLVRIVHEN